MSQSEFTQCAVEVGRQPFASVTSSLVDTGAAASDENLHSINRTEADTLPERFSSDPPAKAVIKPGETDNAFVREEPW